MEDNEIGQRVAKVVSSVLGVKEDDVAPEKRFVDDLGAESVQSLELIAGFEDEFDIEMDEDAALQVKTVGDALSFIRKYL